MQIVIFSEKISSAGEVIYDVDDHVPTTPGEGGGCFWLDHMSSAAVARPRGDKIRGGSVDN